VHGARERGCALEVRRFRFGRLLSSRNPARAAQGQPYTRLLLILGSVALFTVLAALALRSRTAQAHFSRHT
jgi:hypothetical protein